ncbi:CPBP family intramembrane glutamic endopeptidase [Georgenia subflava]|nr:type II CAAX endopeptidase family protein [Georgenia subflava]
MPLILRLVIVGAGALVIWLAIASLGTVLWDEEMSLARHLANALSAFVLAGLLVVVARKLLDRRPVATLGLTRGLVAVRDLLYGALTWLLPAAVGLGVALGAGWLQIEINATVAETIGVVLLLIVLVFVYEAFPEELVFRGYIYRNLTTAMAPWLAILAQALIFAAFGTTLWVVTHGWGVLLERLVMFFGMAVVAGCIRLISGSIWSAVGFHLAFQVVMQMFLSGQYLEVSLSDDRAFIVATAVVAFATAATIAGAFWRGQPNWTRPEPDTALPAAHATSRRLSKSDVAAVRRSRR